MATHPSILARKISRTEETGRLQSMGSQSVGRDWATEHAHNFLSVIIYQGAALESFESRILTIFMK